MLNLIKITKQIKRLLLTAASNNHLYVQWVYYIEHITGNQIQILHPTTSNTAHWSHSINTYSLERAAVYFNSISIISEVSGTIGENGKANPHHPIHLHWYTYIVSSNCTSKHFHFTHHSGYIYECTKVTWLSDQPKTNALPKLPATVRKRDALVFKNSRLAVITLKQPTAC